MESEDNGSKNCPWHRLIRSFDSSWQQQQIQQLGNPTKAKGEQHDNPKPGLPEIHTLNTANAYKRETPKCISEKSVFFFLDLCQKYDDLYSNLKRSSFMKQALN